MYALCRELQRYVEACEHLLSLNLQDDLTQDERNLLVFYLNEMSDRLASISSAVGKSAYELAASRESAVGIDSQGTKEQATASRNIDALLSTPSPLGIHAELYCGICDTRVAPAKATSGGQKDWPYCPVHHRPLIVKSVSP